MLRPTMIIDKASFSQVTKHFLSALALIFIAGLGVSSAQKGKVAGQILDAKTLEPLPGVNVLVEGTSIGAATDIDGFYSLINLTAGTYTIRITYVGYAPYIVNNVQVNVGLTTTIDAKITEEVFVGEEVIVQAERPVVQVDISSNQANISREEIKNLPVTTISAVVGLQAGVEGLSVRGGGSDDLAFNVNGLTMRDERTNQPLTNISFTSISNIQVQTGGFNAEYGNIRSGLINVTTKEGNAEKFEVDALIRYTPVQAKNYDQLPNDPESYFLKPFLDPEVAFIGTSGWDKWTSNQYPSFEGWNSVSERLLSDDDPSNDLTPEAAQQLFKWQHRKTFEITNPDYDIDMNISGPVWGLSKTLGNLRFSFSVRKTQTMYFIPLATDRYLSDSYMLKVTSDISKGKKLSIESMYGKDSGTGASTGGGTGFFVSSSGIAEDLDRVNYTDARIYSNFYWAPSDRSYYSVGATFTHSLSATTFYEVKYNNVTTSYNTNPGRTRGPVGAFEVGGISYDEAPFNFYDLKATSGIGSGMRMSVGMSNSRDTSRVSANTLKFDLTSQVNRVNQVKTGLEIVYTNSNVNYGRYDKNLPSTNVVTSWDKTPLRAAAYVQDKLEFKGMIMNLGLRLDVSKPGGDWYVYDNYDSNLGSNASGIDTALAKESIKPQILLSPRLGVSFPITTESKLFFNYGHFYNMPTPENLYLAQQAEGNAISRMANPNNPLPKTVAYELGYEQDIVGQYLLRVSGYYRDNSQQPTLVRYTSSSGLVNYTRSEPLSYSDTRGFELTVQKVKGKYFRGLANFTYRITSWGLFDFQQQFESKNEQRNYERTTTANDQNRPLPQPLARVVLDFFSPNDFGPKVGNINPLGGWTLSLINSWKAGSYLTWANGVSIPGIVNNVQIKDYYNTDLRMSKNVTISKSSRVQFFLDISNLLNIRRLSFEGFINDGHDYNDYMRSLHLSSSVLKKLENQYLTVPGSDKPGDYRKPGTEFVPIVTVKNIGLASNPSTRPIYYDYEDKVYYQYVNNQMVVADSKLVDKVLKNKQYIDMPNQEYLNFLNPRTYRLGFRVSF